MNTGLVILFSSVQMEYISKMRKLCARPIREVYSLKEHEYRQLAKGSKWDRCRLRLIMYIIFPVRLFWVSLMARKGQTLLVSSNPFFAPLVAWLGSRIRRPELVHWLTDTYPDALVVAGVISRGRILEKIIGCVQSRINQTCDHIVFVGQRLMQHAQQRWGHARKATYIDNVPSDETLFLPFKAGSNGTIILHYGGQLGYMHDMESLLRGVIHVTTNKIPEIVFDFRISGVHQRRFAEGLERTGIEVGDPVTNAIWKEMINDFHIGLVSLSPGGATVSLPSKVYAMMAGGLAIVAICPAWSDLAQIICESECGWVVNNSPYSDFMELTQGDYEARSAEQRPADEVGREFAVLVERLAAERSVVEKARSNALKAGHGRFGLRELGQRWSSVLERPDCSSSPVVVEGKAV